MENGRTDNGVYTETDIIETVDEQGEKHYFEKITEFEVDEQEYALLIYKGTDYAAAMAGGGGEEEGYDEEVVVMRITYEDGAETYEDLQDDEERRRVAEYIDELADEDLDVDIDITEFMADLPEDPDADPKN